MLDHLSAEPAIAELEQKADKTKASEEPQTEIQLAATSTDLPEKPNIIVEFKQGEDIESLAEQALRQIMEQKYYHGLKGKTICVGLAHDKKRCHIDHNMIEI